MNVRPLALALTLLALGSCSNDEPKVSTASVETTTFDTLDSTLPPTESAPSTPPTTSTSTSPTSDVPTSIVDSEIDWREVVETLGQRRQDLYANPDVSRISEICASGGPCEDQLVVQIGDLASKGWRVVEAAPYSVLKASVESFDEGDSPDTALVVTLVVLVERPDSSGRIVDDSGSTIAVVEAETPDGVNTENRTVLVRTGSDSEPWRVVSQERLREVPA